MQKKALEFLPFRPLQAVVFFDGLMLNNRKAMRHDFLGWEDYVNPLTLP